MKTKILLQTERLIIRPFKAEDIGEFYSLVSKPEVMRYIHQGEPLDLGQAALDLFEYRMSYATLGYSRYALELKSNRNFIGLCGFLESGKDIDLGWRVLPKYWGQGYATEAAKTIVAYGFEELRFKKLISIAYLANKPSIRIMQKIGMEFDRPISLYNKPGVRYKMER